MGKFISDIEEFLGATKAITTFSQTHNITRKDIESLFIFSADLDGKLESTISMNKKNFNLSNGSLNKAKKIITGKLLIIINIIAYKS